MVLATMPFPASPMDTKSGLSRPGTATLKTRIGYPGEVAGCYRRDYLRTTVGMPARIFGDDFSLGE